MQFQVVPGLATSSRRIVASTAEKAKTVLKIALANKRIAKKRFARAVSFVRIVGCDMSKRDSSDVVAVLLIINQRPILREG